ncbi:hypothetical protein FA13DRAFT_1756971 [Coprinellus micaceus]|uniref:G domain-containing protein n=1 Tax=Coprinellus micaceus TaxID=71717 RepID=A0A4Y7SR67_COPMI|nr:hypothetical protein FA13DRAFT_1756971 [Coprinellus micaceus]
MGATGGGKTTVSSSLKTSDGLRSCTETVAATDPFLIDGRKVVLVDTPGFDDTTKTDSDVLKLIAQFLTSSYQSGHKLTGLLFFHRISDFRMGGISLKNFRTFRSLCGEQTLRNVVIAEERERELSIKDDFFKPALDKGAQMMRHYNTPESAQKIVRHLLKNNPMALQIQREIVDEHRDVPVCSIVSTLPRYCPHLHPMNAAL